VAEQYQAEDFKRAKALEGGVEAWKEAGYGVMAPR
jgi:hypothetical protein